MARCEQGYLCSVCGREVETLTDSDLYLGFVLGEVPAEQLHLRHDRHIRCNPERAQYIMDPSFLPVRCEGSFDKATLANDYVAEEEARITRGWRRLCEVVGTNLPIVEYPLPEFREASSGQE
jgi:hypothetical protein